MKSNVCKIENGSQDLNAIFAECEKVAAYNGLDHKQAMQLRLLCEEIDGMLPQIVEDFYGDIWFEFEDGVCKVKVSFQMAELTTDKKEKLIDVAKNKKNAEATGLIGKIRSGIEDFFLVKDEISEHSFAAEPFYMATGYNEVVDYSYIWSLEHYRNTVKKEEQAEKWDELEKSVIASIADDVTVGIKGKRADIVVVKRFA